MGWERKFFSWITVFFVFLGVLYLFFPFKMKKVEQLFEKSTQSMIEKFTKEKTSPQKQTINKALKIKKQTKTSQASKIEKNNFLQSKFTRWLLTIPTYAKWHDLILKNIQKTQKQIQDWQWKKVSQLQKIFKLKKVKIQS